MAGEINLEAKRVILEELEDAYYYAKKYEMIYVMRILEKYIEEIKNL